jgi:hypothetical protein
MSINNVCIHGWGAIFAVTRIYVIMILKRMGLLTNSVIAGKEFLRSTERWEMLKSKGF